MKNIDFMQTYVEDFVSGKCERWQFELDFDHELICRYNKMLRENREYAELFAFYVSEQGIDVGRGLSDDEFKRLIARQLKKVKRIDSAGYY